MNSKATVLTILTAIFLLLAGTTLKVYLSASSELDSAERLAIDNNLSDAVVHFERSIRWYLPGLHLQDRAAEGLWKIGLEYESRSDTENALSAYRLLRGGIYATRSFYTPAQDWIHRCNEKIAFLMAVKAPPNSTGGNKSLEQRTQEFLLLLTAEKSPSAPWALLAVAGFFGWVICCFFFIARGLTKTGVFQTGPALLWGGGFILFYGLWILGLYNA